MLKYIGGILHFATLALNDKGSLNDFLKSKIPKTLPLVTRRFF